MTDTRPGDCLPKALEVLKSELEGETPLPAAVHVLKACGSRMLPHVAQSSLRPQR